MSDAHNTRDDGPHEGPIKTPKQLIVAVFFAFVVPIIVIVLLVSFVSSSPRPAAGSDGLAPEAVARRIQPVGVVEVRDASDPTTLKTGQQVYTAQCVACHGAGVAGAPASNDAAAWAPRIAQGYDVLLTSALKGKGAMGPQAGGDHTDLEIARAVVYMANNAGAKFPEPTAPGVEAPTTTAAAPVAPAAALPVAPVIPPPQVPAAPAAAPSAGGATAAAKPALYDQICVACHAAGVAGAPRSGDKAAWAPRIAQGIDALTASTIKGKGAMPPRGGSRATDEEIRAVVAYMIELNK